MSLLIIEKILKNHQKCDKVNEFMNSAKLECVGDFLVVHKPTFINRTMKYLERDVVLDGGGGVQICVLWC